MAYVSIADRDHEVEHHDPDTFITKYVYSQDHKVIAIQYGGIAILVGLVALVLSGMMRLQLGFPDTFTFIDPSSYLQFVTMHGMIMVVYLLTALFLGVFIIAFTMGGLNYVTTVLQARCRGMTLMRMPLTVWGIFTATVLGLLAFPALLVSAIMMTLDKGLGTSFFMPAVLSMGESLEHTGGSPILFQHLFWFFGHPEVYIVALPAFGIVSDLLSVHARKNIFGYRMMVWAIVAIGALSFVVWAHHMYVSGMNPYFGFFFATTTLIIAIPTAIKVYNWVLTLWKGNIRLTVPMLFAIGFIFTFTHGGLTGLFLGNVTVDLPLSDTYFVIGHFHMVMGVSPVLALFGALYHWYPKMSGRMFNERLGVIHFWCTFLGTYAIYLPMHYLGIMGLPRRYFAYGDMAFMPDSAQTMNAGITIAALFVGVTQLIFLYNMIVSLRNGKESGGNPWEATTLEWLTPDTPPKHGNWGHDLPVVHRWAYDYSVPGAPTDFTPQTEPHHGDHDSVNAMGVHLADEEKVD
jgi:cytochrome c oxidase subunit 1